MATNKEYLNFILDQLSELDGITHRQMMGEYIIYHHGKIAAYLCDDRLLIKPVASAVKMIPVAKYELPYDGAKEMLLVENVDDRTFLKRSLSTILSKLPLIGSRRVISGFWNT